MTLYNTLTRRKEEFVPLNPGRVKIYACGPTVYNYTHIGNARPAVAFDALRRYLLYKGCDVNFVSNFTDVDDKIIKRANEENVSSAAIAQRYITEYYTDADGLNVLRATAAPRVTAVIPDIIEMISVLIEKGRAYGIDGSVYFDAARAEGYGRLSGKNIDELIAGARAERDEKKKSPQDFVLWKPAKPDEPKWDSPWGEGRPGWHIECSVMAKKFLGDTIDVHCGGEDLIFPHHENEIAQSEAANGVKFANYWLHNGMINVDGQKMSKSKGNFFTTRELAEKYGYDVLRFYIIASHYRSPLNFSGELLEAAARAMERVRRCADALRAAAFGGEFTAEDKAVLGEADVFTEQFEAAMDDDLNTANAVSAVFGLVRFANANAAPGPRSAAFLKRLERLTDVLGLVFSREAGNNDESAAIAALVGEREAARKAKDWAKADEIRNRLKSMGVTVSDTPGGAKWSRDA